MRYHQIILANLTGGTYKIIRVKLEIGDTLRTTASVRKLIFHRQYRSSEYATATRAPYVSRTANLQ